VAAYQAERLPSGQMRYGAPSGQHDDCVMALAIAWTPVSGRHRAVYPAPESDLLVPPFAIPPAWPRACALYIGSNSSAVIWGALDPETGVIYLYEECGGSRDATVAHQVQQIHRRGGIGYAGTMHGVIGFAGGDPADQDRFMWIYCKAGLWLCPAKNLVESGIAEVTQRMSQGRLKVFSTLTRYREELRLYCRDEGGQLVSGSSNFQDAARCLVASEILRAPRKPGGECERRSGNGDGLRWMA
jgi:hypothetical protein